MTENKRFISKNESIINVATDEVVNASCEESAKILVDWLNEFNDENEVLIQGILMKEEIINDLKDDINKCNIQCRKIGSENEQLKSEISMKDNLIQQLRIKLNKDWYNKWKRTIQQYTDVCEELLEINKDYERMEKDRDQLNDVVQHVWNVLLDIDRDKLCFEQRRFFDKLCNELGFDLSRIRMIEIDIPTDSASDK